MSERTGRLCTRSATAATYLQETDLRTLRMGEGGGVWPGYAARGPAVGNSEELGACLVPQVLAPLGMRLSGNGLPPALGLLQFEQFVLLV